MASKAKLSLINTFLDLANEVDYEKITVTSLVEKCGISRQTFYYHFNDIDEMLKWAFESETEVICAKQPEGKWIESAKLYVGFLDKYDAVLRSAAKSSSFIFIFNLINDSFNKYISAYLISRLKNPSATLSDNQFIVSCLSNGFAGLVIAELQKPRSDYETLLVKIARGFNLISK